MFNMNEVDNEYCEFELDIEIETWQICTLCKSAFETESDLQKHNKLAHPEPPIKFRSVYLDALRLKEGNEIANRVPSFKALQQKQERERQRKTFSGSYNDQTFQCDLCYKMFSRKSSLKRHIGYHTEGKFFGCDNCGMQFRKEHRLKTHKKLACVIATTATST